MCECVNRGGSKNKINVIFYEIRYLAQNTHTSQFIKNKRTKRTYMFIYDVFGLLNILNAKSGQM